MKTSGSYRYKTNAKAAFFSQWQQIGIFRWASLIKLIQEPEPKTNISSKTSPEKTKIQNTTISHSPFFKQKHTNMVL